jgi:hypothetical protein
MANQYNSTAFAIEPANFPSLKGERRRPGSNAAWGAASALTTGWLIDVTGDCEALARFDFDRRTCAWLALLFNRQQHVHLPAHSTEERR